MPRRYGDFAAGWLVEVRPQPSMHLPYFARTLARVDERAWAARCATCLDGGAAGESMGLMQALPAESRPEGRVNTLEHGMIEQDQA